MNPCCLPGPPSTLSRGMAPGWQCSGGAASPGEGDRGLQKAPAARLRLSCSTTPRRTPMSCSAADSEAALPPRERSHPGCRGGEKQQTQQPWYFHSLL